MMFLKTDEKLPYPKSVLYILAHQVFERFSFWGIVVVLPLFLRNVLGFNDDSATSIYHGFTIFGYLSAFVGAVLADSFFGKFWTINIFSLVYLFGTSFLTLSATSVLQHDWTIGVAVLGLILTALASGSIKPCIIAFGGDQFTLPQQQKQLDNFFPIFYLIINFSLFFTAIFTPILRKDVSCFGEETCYSLAVAIPFCLVLISSVIFLIGKTHYRKNPAEENVVWNACRCFWIAIRERFAGYWHSRPNKHEHWLEYANPKFDSKFIADLKRVLSLLVLCLPVTVFWALYDQQFSRWTFQASRMNGKVFGYAIKPDQFATMNFILTFILIPIFDKCVYPILLKCGLLTKPLQRTICGSTFASISFIICACVELKVESTIEALPSTMKSHLNVINSYNSTLQVSLSQTMLNKIEVEDQEIYIGTVPPFKNYIFRNIPSSTSNMQINVVSGSSKANFAYTGPLLLYLENGKAHSVLVYPDRFGAMNIIQPEGPDDLEKSLENNSKLRLICGDLDETSVVSIVSESGVRTTFPNCTAGATKTIGVPPSRYYIEEETPKGLTDLLSVELEMGGSYILSLTRNISENGIVEATPIIANVHTITSPNSVSMLLLLPQYFVMSMAEVMLEISLTGYLYQEAPKNMKSLLQVVNLIPPALGGVLVITLAKAKLFQRQSLEFFLFAGINLCAVLVLIILAKRYRPVEVSETLVHQEERSSNATSTTTIHSQN